MSRSRDGMLLTTRSPIRSSPSEMSSRPATMRRAVVFPQPDGPTSTTNSPSSIPRSTWLTARGPSGKTFDTPSNETPATSKSLPSGTCSGTINEMHPVLREYLDELAKRLRQALGDPLVAVYLSGSTAVGAERAGTSDVDVLVVVEKATREALERVVALCGHDALPCPAEKLELVVYERTQIADARWSLNFDTGGATHHVGFDPAAEPAHWF